MVIQKRGLAQGSAFCMFELFQIIIMDGIRKKLPPKHPQMLKSQPNSRFRTIAVTLDTLDLSLSNLKPRYI